MSAVASNLWQRLAAHEIGPSDASLTFAQRLARENRWSHAFTARVLREYKRFCYLAVATGHEVTPSDAVDQAWHLHLTYSRDYWEHFCPEVLGAPLHHGPTAGGQAERTRYYDQYAATLKSYEQMFGEPPPADIWPTARRRFLVDPKGVRVNPQDVMIVSRIWVILILMAGALLFVGALLLAGSG
ncbi:glycine-rich domain-containing protein [Qipengyuania qiaonensis]|uniref:Glycine-rich domain-containing protein-like n=1 Tax=Qipengyuania qiaonensis TaxID=2867240 RepID=A0ABS7J0Z5_9SPHN|nr:hypothetical protein [Qipengyuania qiaonensis]MBX7481027.1 hypothetical protein [Qipengyuania qiaonensis]